MRPTRPRPTIPSRPDHPDKVIDIDQSIGRTPRSIQRPIPAPSSRSATGLPACRKPRPAAMGSTPDPAQRRRGCRRVNLPGRWADQDRDALPARRGPCDVRKAAATTARTLEVLFKGKSIADVLDMTVEEAVPASSRRQPAADPRQDGHAETRGLAMSRSASRRQPVRRRGPAGQVSRAEQGPRAAPSISSMQPDHGLH